MKRHQVAALPVRRDKANRLQVLLVTSRETRRWVVPKGWPWRDVADHDAAAGEAWEEAGVRGIVGTDSIGSFSYYKRRNGKSHLVEVAVFLLHVTEEVSSWPEMDERERKWFMPARAADAVDEAGLKALIKNLSFLGRAVVRG